MSLTHELSLKLKLNDFVTTLSILKCTPIKRSINTEGNSPDTEAATFQDIKPEYVAKNVLASISQNCWKIALNSNCDLKSQLGFLVEEGKINLGLPVIEGKTIPRCGKKSIPY